MALRESTGALWQSRLMHRWRFYAGLFALLVPTLGTMIVFGYYPKFSVIKYSFYRWDGGGIEEFVGFKNFVQALTADPMFWQSFQLVAILLAANLVKMWPSIFAAVAVHRLRNQRWQYLYRVLFVIPMVIPALVWLLVWKSFFDPTVGILNQFLNMTGLMSVLQALDVFMPQLADAIRPVVTHGADPIFGNVWGLGLAGLLLATMPTRMNDVIRQRPWWILVLIAGWFFWGHLRGAAILALAVAVFVTPVHLRATLQSILARFGIGLMVAMALLVATTMIWYEPTKAFGSGQPGWLGHSKLVIPAVVLWGFPWVSTIGVLLYLAGLQNISTDVYDAADIDGISSAGKLFRIELPLILTAVRINLILMTIGTLNDYVFFLVLLGKTGGPGGRGMVPGLYMYSEAFNRGHFGYACALGMVLFVIILVLTIFYQRFVTIEK